MKSQEEKAREVCEEREKSYGDPGHMCEQVAAHWTAILRSYYPEHDLPEIPPHLVGLMMAALKIHRAATPYDKKDEDSYVDMLNYIEFSRSMDPTLPAADEE